MVDDVIAVSRCGVDSVAMNGFLNQKTSLQKLQFEPDKCHPLHVGRSNICCPELYIDEWALKKKDKFKAGIESLIDVHVVEVDQNWVNQEPTRNRKLLVLQGSSWFYQEVIG